MGFISPGIQLKWDNKVPVEGHFRVSGSAPFASQQDPCIQMKVLDMFNKSIAGEFINGHIILLIMGETEIVLKN